MVRECLPKPRVRSRFLQTGLRTEVPIVWTGERGEGKIPELGHDASDEWEEEDSPETSDEADETIDYSCQAPKGSS